MGEKQIGFCTEKCARLHRFLCMQIKGVKLKVQKFEVNFE